MKKISNVLWGILFIVVGIVWALNATGLADINIFFRGWWTLFIIIPGIISIIDNPKDPSNFIVLVIGVCLLLASRNIISFGLILKLIVPAIFILIGLKIIFRDSFDKGVSQKISQIDKDGTEIYAATFSENRVKLVGNEFNNAKLDATFGSVVLDIAECDIQKDGVISASAIFGGVEIIVPRDVNVKLKTTGIFGGTDNRVVNRDEEGRKTIYIETLALFGGVEIK